MLKFTYSFSAVKVIIALLWYYLLFFSCQGHNSLALFSNLLSKLLIQSKAIMTLTAEKE
jgi:hypothetical protein